MQANSNQHASTIDNAAADGKAGSSPAIVHRMLRGGSRTIKLDFASKGLTEVKFEENGDDEGPEARVHGTALYSPAPGWPTGYGQYRPNDLKGVTYPVKVNFRIALTNTPEGELIQLMGEKTTENDITLDLQR